MSLRSFSSVLAAANVSCLVALAACDHGQDRAPSDAPAHPISDDTQQGSSWRAGQDAGERGDSDIQPRDSPAVQDASSADSFTCVPPSGAAIYDVSTAECLAQAPEPCGEPAEGVTEQSHVQQLFEHRLRDGGALDWSALRYDALLVELERGCVQRFYAASGKALDEAAKFRKQLQSIRLACFEPLSCVRIEGPSTLL
jgi:hypothetical protein